MPAMLAGVNMKLKDIPIFWINLDRRTDRAAWFIHNNIVYRPDLHWIRVSGVDPWWHAIAQSEPKGATVGQAGAWLAHRAALQAALAYGADRFIIMEDDAMILPEFDQCVEALDPRGHAIHLNGPVDNKAALTCAVMHDRESASRWLAALDQRRGHIDQQVLELGISIPSPIQLVRHCYDILKSDTAAQEEGREVGKHGSDHSQFGEQRYILEYFGDYVGTFLDLGAFDGIEGSNSRGLTDRSWSGVCVEANPITFARLAEAHRLNPRVQLVNAAVMPKAGLVEFFDTGSQVSTALQANRIGEWVQRKYSVAAVTPNQLADRFGVAHDFVSFDMEGVDLEVLKHSERLLTGTKLLCIEHTQPGHGFQADYYSEMMTVLSRLRFRKIVAMTGEGGRVGASEKATNTIIARA